MKNKHSAINTKMKTRAELINSSRRSVALDFLAPKEKATFHILDDFKPGVSQFVEISKPKKFN